MDPKETPTKHSLVPKFSPLIVILSPGFMGSGSTFVILGRALMSQTGALSTESPGPPTDGTSSAPEPIPGMVISAAAVESKPTARPRAMPRMTNAVEIFVLMGDTPSINVGSGVPPFAPARRQLAQDLLGLLHPLLGLDVRGPGLPGRAFDGHGHRRDLPDSLLLVAIEAFRLGRIEIQRLLLLEIPPASFAVVLV